jgi:hypothetical protein
VTGEKMQGEVRATGAIVANGVSTAQRKQVK